MLPTPSELDLNADAWWPGQEDAINFFTDPATHARILIAPTGSGKSLMQTAAIQLMHQASTTPLVAYALTNTKQLQDQLLRTMPSVHLMKGRSNYPCSVEDGLVSVEEGPCQSGWKCPTKWSCGYYAAKARVPVEPLTSMNYAIYLTDRKYLGDFPSPDILIGDEAHNLETTLMSAVTIEVRASTCAFAGIPTPPNTVPAAIRWATKNEPAVRMKMLPLQQQQAKDPDSFTKEEVQTLKKLRSFHRTLTDLATLARPENWVAESTNPLILKPIFVRDYTGLLWGGVGQLLLTSATILDPAYFADTLSLGSYAVHEMASSFDPKRRPIIVDPIKLPLTYKTEQETDSPSLAQMAAKVDELIARHPSQKGIIHCGSYRRAEVIRSLSIHSSRLIFPTPETKDYWLAPLPNGCSRWELDPRPLVMVSPAVWEGVDMPGEQNEFQVICKVPYPSLGSPWVRARMQVDPKYYPIATSLALIQTCGRAMRNHKDKGVTYIIDPAINRVLDEWGAYLSAWWRKAVVRNDRPARPNIRRIVA